MNRFPLPSGWHGITTAPEWLKPYGWYDCAGKYILVSPPAWIPTWFGLRQYFTAVIWNHEALHAWRNPGCDSSWCLGYEGPKWKEYLAMPFQLLAGFRFCDQCMAYIPARGAQNDALART